MLPLERQSLPVFYLHTGEHSFCNKPGCVCMQNNKQLEAFLRIRYIGLHLARSSYRTDKNFSFFPSIEFLRRDWIGVFVWIISQYNTRKYPGKVIYYWAREEAKHIRTWWGKVAEAEALEVHLIPGSHTTCRTDHLEDLATHLRRNLDEAQG